MNKMLMGIGATIFATSAISGAIALGPAERRAKALAEYQPVGEPVNCISIQQIRSTRIINNQTIDFEMTGGKTYRNTLPHSCSGLMFEDRFSYRTSQSRLCNVDIIRVLHNYGGRLEEGNGCGLGKFQPVVKTSKIQDISYQEGEWTPFEIVEPGPVTG